MSTRELSTALQATADGLELQDSMYVLPLPITFTKLEYTHTKELLCWNIDTVARWTLLMQEIQVQPAELKAIISGFTNPDPLWGNGVHIGGDKYVLTKADTDRNLYARKVYSKKHLYCPARLRESGADSVPRSARAS